MGCRPLVERGELCELVRFSETKHMNEQHERSRKVNSIARNSRISSTQRESNVPMGNSQQKWRFVAGENDYKWKLSIARFDYRRIFMHVFSCILRCR